MFDVGMRNLDELDSSIAKMEANLSVVKARRADLLSEGDDKTLANRIHKKTCRENHKGYECYWNRENNNGVVDWTAKEHKRFLTKAQRILEISEMMDAVEIVDIIGDRWA